MGRSGWVGVGGGDTLLEMWEETWDMEQSEGRPGGGNDWTFSHKVSLKEFAQEHKCFGMFRCVRIFPARNLQDETRQRPVTR